MADKTVDKDATVIDGEVIDRLVINANDVRVRNSRVTEVVNNGINNVIENSTELGYIREADPVAVAEDRAAAEKAAAKSEEKKTDSKK